MSEFALSGHVGTLLWLLKCRFFCSETSRWLHIFARFSENSNFCVEKCKIFSLYFQGFMKNVTKK